MSDPQTLKRIRDLAKGIVDDVVDLRMSWLSERDGIAVPTISASHFNENYAASLSLAIQGLGYPECFAVATEPLEEELSFFQVETTKEGLLEFDRKCSHFNFVLLPHDGAFAVLCTTDDYFLVAGPREFVIRACGNVRVARKEFFHYAQGNDRLLRIASRYDRDEELAE